MKNRNKKGFTLVELVIVIAVIAILAGVLIGTFATVISNANKSKALQEWKATIDETYVDYMANKHVVPGSVLVSGKTITFGENTPGDTYKDYIVLPTADKGYVVLDSKLDIYLSWDKGSYSVATSTTNLGSELTTKVGTST